MLARRFGIMGILAIFLAPLGCGRDASDERMMEIVIKVERQEQELNRLAKNMERMDDALNEIQTSLRKIARASGGVRPAGSGETRAADFRDTPEYRRIATALSAIQQQLNIAESDPTRTKEAMADALELAERRTADSEFYKELQSIYNPEQMRESLDIIVEQYAQHIEDTARRQEVYADVEQLRRINSNDMDASQLYERLVSELTQRSNTSQDRKFREWVERQLGDLQSPSGEEQDEVLERCLCFYNVLRIRELSDKCQIPVGSRGGIAVLPWEE